MADKQKSSQRFRRTRSDHAAEAAEDYTELIASMIERAGEARVSDIAVALGVTHVAVSRMVGRLKALGLAKSEPYGPITLTPKGRTMATRARRRHEVVVQFLVSIGVPSAQAETDAEGIEHHCSEATLSAMRRSLSRAH